MKKATEQKRVWETPDLVVYGDINSLTQQQKQYMKQPGSSDDFAVNASNFP